MTATIAETTPAESLAQAGALALAGEFATAAAMCRHACADAECRLAALTCLAEIQWQMGLHAEYRETCIEVFAGRFVESPLGVYGRGTLALRAGDYANGFRDCEARLQVPAAVDNGIVRALHGVRYWDGADADTLLVAQDAGFGDTLMMLRYVPWLRARARRLVLMVDPRLAALIAHSFGVEIVDRVPAYGITAWASSLSLPAMCGTTAKTIPRAPYLRVPKTGRLGLSARRPRVGVAWASSNHDGLAERRSCRLADLAPLLAVRDAVFCSLQVGPRASDGDKIGIRRVLPDAPTFAETAAVMGQLDLVVTVDTAVAHLAGALGLPTLMLLPIGAAWMWGMRADTTPWYPSARLIRQSSRGDWHDVGVRAAVAVRRWRRDAMPAPYHAYSLDA
jgi:hypothetical protein